MMTIRPTSGCSLGTTKCATSATIAAATAAPPMNARSRLSYGTRGGGTCSGALVSETVIRLPCLSGNSLEHERLARRGIVPDVNRPIEKVPRVVQASPAAMVHAQHRLSFCHGRPDRRQHFDADARVHHVVELRAPRAEAHGGAADEFAF